ncbi:PadR family transcriptional regulator [Lactococcus nasutitermitis]|uniref:PadR family transcriptional regulator n=1 Tax=Lactococcus nasutitermitis TaxID=1652957 RepID=A0ABV9JAB1_9LACT|nr:helix-turn-helix transcriptional regulator [Lactococcus nasutitermitis]
MVNKIALSILSLIAREPLSGYDIKQQMNDRISHFLKVNNNQVYPQIAHLEAEGFLRLTKSTKPVQNPTKKTYEITEFGLEELKTYTVLDFGEATIKDGFMFKVYNSWLLTRDEMLDEIEKELEKHQERAEIFEEKLEVLGEVRAEQELASRAILEYGKMYEENYIHWCERLRKEFLEK